MDGFLLAQSITGQGEVLWVIENFSKITLSGALLYVIWASKAGVFVWGDHHRATIKEINERHERELAKMERDRDEWKAEARAGRQTLKQAANVAETIATVAAEKK